MPWENHSLKSNFGLTSVQIENSHSLLKVYTASLVDGCICSQKLGIRKGTIAQNREENSRQERKRREERKCLVYFEGAGEDTIYTVSGAAGGEEKRSICGAECIPS